MLKGFKVCIWEMEMYKSWWKFFGENVIINNKEILGERNVSSLAMLQKLDLAMDGTGHSLCQGTLNCKSCETVLTGQRKALLKERLAEKRLFLKERVYCSKSPHGKSMCPHCLYCTSCLHCLHCQHCLYTYLWTNDCYIYWVKAPKICF